MALAMESQEDPVTERRPSDRAFGLVFSGLFGAIALAAWALGGRPLPWALALGGALLVLAVVAPGVLLPANRLWGLLGQRVARLSNFVLLGSFYFLVVVPFGLAARLLRLSSLRKRPDPSVASYWAPVERQATADTYPDLF
jgi:hypothetical protein